MKAKLNACLASVFAIFLAGSAFAGSAAIFNQAIADGNQINSNLPTRERLAAYERVLGALDRIVAEFPSSPEARILLSGQAVGSFSPNAFRREYITELTSYYDTVCEVSPSYTCLAFVSLRSGADVCQNGTTIEDLEVAYESLGNALRIFTSQSQNAAFRSVAIATARQCAARNLDSWNRDYFSSKLVDMLLLGGQVAAARATIENMETAYFRFVGALALRRTSGDLVDQQYLDRLERFIEENIAQSLEGPRAPNDAFLATLSLRMFALSHSSVELDYNYLRDATSKYTNFGPTETCDGQYASYLFNTILDFQVGLFSLSHKRGLSDMQIVYLLDSIAEDPHEIFAACLDGEYYDLTLMAKIHGQLLWTSGVQQAESFRNVIRDRAFTREEIFDIYLDYLAPQLGDLAKSYFHEEYARRKYVPVWYISPAWYASPFEPGGWEQIWDDRRSLGLYFNPATFPVFKRFVDGGDVCRASEILFRELSDTPRFEEAVEYMIQSPSIRPETQYSCGDEELELLLGR